MFIDHVLDYLNSRYLNSRSLQEETEEDDDWLFQKKGTFVVTAYYPSSMEIKSTKTFSDAGQAVQQWFKMEKSCPSCVCITCWKAQAEELRKWAVGHENEIRNLAKANNCPYKVDYILDACKKPVTGSDKFPDQVHPFDLG